MSGLNFLIANEKPNKILNKPLLEKGKYFNNVRERFRVIGFIFSAAKYIMNLSFRLLLSKFFIKLR
jgi:hypothetical protein